MEAAAVPESAHAEPGISSRRRVAGRAGTGALMLGALGVVFGDIGTSPLYAVQSAFSSDRPVQITHAQVYGLISLVFWTITMVVSVKYVTFIMRADDRGEGGIMALTGLLDGAKKRTTTIVALVTLGIVGASLFYGDGAITPAISVLSAVEGLKVVEPSLGSVVVPITVAVLTALFAIQRFGTELVGRLFGPIMALWFGTLAVIGLAEIVPHPQILEALSPTFAIEFFAEHGAIAFVALGSAVLAVTGAEALYADMGHFGRSPIRRAWFVFVFPALTLNYLAQGSLVLRDPPAKLNPFYLLLPSWGRVPMVVLATIATVIASQAVISGAYSVTQQAVSLNFLPRVRIRHTSEHEIGQIYVPALNMFMFVIVVAIVVGFGSSARLASAYGVAVTGTFILTTILFLGVSRLLWHKRKRLLIAWGVVFLTIDVLFFAGQLTKIADGGWLPLSIALAVVTLLLTWHSGRTIVSANRTAAEGPLRDFIEQLDEDHAIQHVPGVAVFLNPSLETTPLALRANVEHNHVVHDQVVIVSVRFEREAHIPDEERVVRETRIMFSAATGDPLGAAADRITALTLRFGFLDEPDVPSALVIAAGQGLLVGAPDIAHATYFLSQISVLPTRAAGMARWRKKLYVLLSRNAADPAAYFRLPDERTVSTSGRIAL